MRKPEIASEYIVYLQESDIVIGVEDDPTTFYYLSVVVNPCCGIMPRRMRWIQWLITKFGI